MQYADCGVNEKDTLPGTPQTRVGCGLQDSKSFLSVDMGFKIAKKTRLPVRADPPGCTPLHGIHLARRHDSFPIPIPTVSIVDPTKDTLPGTPQTRVGCCDRCAVC